MLRKIIPILILILTFAACQKEVVERDDQVYVPFLQVSSPWVDSLLAIMTPEEKIGQLIVIQSSLKNPLKRDSFYNWVRTGQVGGFILEELPVDQFVSISDSAQMLAPIGLLSGTKENVNLNRQFSDLTPFPIAASVAAIQSDSVHNYLSDLFVQQCKSMGINFSCSPSVEFNLATDKSYNFQCYENDTTTLLERASVTIENLQENNILSFAQNFSDYRNTKNDTIGKLDAALLPYYDLSNNGLSGLVVGPQVMKIDSFDRMPIGYLQSYLLEQLDFEALLIGNVSEEMSIKDLIRIGVDVFIVKEDFTRATQVLRNLYQTGFLPIDLLNQKVAKVLMAKAWLGLNNKQNTDVVQDSMIDMKAKHFDFVARKLFEESIILAHNPKELLPLKNINRQRFHILQYGKNHLQEFKNNFYYYASYTSQLISPELKTQSLKPIPLRSHRFATVVLTIDGLKLHSSRDSHFIHSVNQLSQKTNVILVNFGNPYNLQYFDTQIAKVQIFEQNNYTQAFAAQLLFGGLSANGSLPLAISREMPFRQTIPTPKLRLKYTIPEDVGIAPEKLVGIDAFVNSAIKKGATPGCQVLVAKEGKVIYNKAFGHHTYAKKQKVRTTDLYDIASLTKVAATTLAAMKLYQQGKYKVNDRIDAHLDLPKKNTIKYQRLKHLLTHRSRLQANMPVYKYIKYQDTTTNIGNCNPYFCKTQQGDYNIKVADNMYFNMKQLDTMWMEIAQLKLRKKRSYRYSDVNFNLLQKAFEKMSGKGLDQYVYDNFYKPLNLRRILYKPLEEFPARNITPTQDDQKFRKQQLRGYVHDESAALLGGVAGNAGLFADAQDLAVIFQMLLDGGVYGGDKLLEEKTIKYFIKAKHGNHRGLGFDRPKRYRHKSLARKAPSSTYGHTGFTGTCVWVDPDEQLVYVFLSNRIHPNVKNTKLFRRKLRGRVHQVIYDALDSYKTKTPKLKAIEIKKAVISDVEEKEGKVISLGE